MPKLRVREGCTLFYPNGTRRGTMGYVVDPETGNEAIALAGQMDSLEPCPDYLAADAVNAASMVGSCTPPAPAKKKAAKKKAKKKAAKKKAKKKAAKKKAKKKATKKKRGRA